MGQYARDLERETNQEKEKFEKNFEALSKRKDDIIKSKRDKMKVQCGYSFLAVKIIIVFIYFGGLCCKQYGPRSDCSLRRYLLGLQSSALLKSH